MIIVLTCLGFRGFWSGWTPYVIVSLMCGRGFDSSALYHSVSGCRLAESSTAKASWCAAVTDTQPEFPVWSE